MGATFTKTGDWQGTLQGGFQVANKVAGLPEPDEGKVYRRKRNISTRFRFGQGLTGWTSDAGQEVFGSDVDVTNGGDEINFSGEPKALVTSNSLEGAPDGSGIWKETLVTESYTAWEEWEIPTATSAPE